MRYLVRYTVAVHESREVEASSAVEAFRKVSLAADFGEAIVHEVLPDDGLTIAEMNLQAQPDLPQVQRRPPLRLVPENPTIEDLVDSILMVP